jgi:hypothetical protein
MCSPHGQPPAGMGSSGGIQLERSSPATIKMASAAAIPAKADQPSNPLSAGATEVGSD